MPEWSQGPVDPVAERLAVENARKHRASGSRPLSIGERVDLTPRADFWWWLHLSQLSMRLMLQAAKVENRRIDSPQSLEHLNLGWPEALRRIAEAHAYRIGQQQEPAEVARVSEVPAAFPDGAPRPVKLVQRERAVFLSRWFPVPKPGEVGPASWTQPELREIARWVVASVKTDSDAWPEYPDGWRESVDMVRAEVERRR